MADILPYLQTLEEPAREELLQLFQTMPESLRSHSVIQRLKKGQILVSPLDRSDFVYVLISGNMQSTNQDSFGKVYVVADFSAPALFGEFELIAGLPFYGGTLTATSDCRIIALKKEAYLAWVRKNGAILFQRARAVTRQLLRQSGNERNFLFWSGTERLMYLLCQYFEKNAKEGVVLIHATRKDMADKIGASEKTISRGLQCLSEQELIHTKGHKIMLREENYKQLRKMLEKEGLTNSLGEL